MKKKLKYVIFAGVAIVALYVAFMLGRYSFLITQPEFLLGEKDRWLVAKAREHALEGGIPEERLDNPRVVDTTKVYFGGSAGLGGVEVTLIKDNGLLVEMSW